MIIFILIIVMFLLISFIAAKSEETPQKRGKIFEKKTVNTIKDELGAEPVQNILLPNGDMVKGITGSTEIDIVFVNKKGIFCVECKSHIGDSNTIVAGSLTHDMWKVEGETFDLFRNPFTQNSGHIKQLTSALQNQLSVGLHIYNMVVLNNIFSFSYYGKNSNNKDCYFLPNDNKIILTDARGRGFIQLKKEQR